MTKLCCIVNEVIRCSHCERVYCWKCNFSRRRFTKCPKSKINHPCHNPSNLDCELLNDQALLPNSPR